VLVKKRWTENILLALTSLEDVFSNGREEHVRTLFSPSFNGGNRARRHSPQPQVRIPTGVRLKDANRLIMYVP
jgi:hypothetical protein